MSSENIKFFYNGIFFDDKESVLKFQEIYKNSQVSEQTVQDKMTAIGRDLSINIHVCKIQVNNKQFDSIMEKKFLEILRELRELKKNIYFNSSF